MNAQLIKDYCKAHIDLIDAEDKIAEEVADSMKEEVNGIIPGNPNFGKLVAMLIVGPGMISRKLKKIWFMGCLCEINDEQKRLNGDDEF